MSGITSEVGGLVGVERLVVADRTDRIPFGDGGIEDAADDGRGEWARPDTEGAVPGTGVDSLRTAQPAAAPRAMDPVSARKRRLPC